MTVKMTMGAIEAHRPLMQLSRETIDKAPEMGYSKDTKGAASRTAPVCYREVTVTFGRVRRLLLFAILENQSNDS